MVEPGDVEVRREVAGHVFTTTMRGSRCGACGETYLAGADGERFDLAVAEALAFAQPTGDSFRFLRKVAGLRAADLGELLSVTGDTISRWETGKSPIDRSAFTLLGLIVREQAVGSSAVLDMLKAAASPRVLGAEVRLKLAS
jgi:DNA-binding transcriptional regulator YiaG